MNIIFGTLNAKQIEEKYITLELDTFQLGEGGIIDTAYCVIELVPLDEIADLESLKASHSSLMESYKNRDWEACQDSLNVLNGKWNGEMDTFYDVMQDRLNNFLTNEPDESWSPVILREAQYVEQADTSE